MNSTKNDSDRLDFDKIFTNLEADRVRDTLNRLPTKRRDVLYFIWQGKEVNEIAKETGTNRTTIAQHIFAILEDFELRPIIAQTFNVQRISNKISYQVLNELKVRFSNEVDLFLKGYGKKLTPDTDLYVRRPVLEKICYEILQEPGACLRIKAPRRMGKKTFLGQILGNFNEDEYEKISLSLISAPMNSLEEFFKWLCITLGDELLGDKFDLKQSFTTYWRDQLPPQYNLGQYFQKYLLPNIKNKDTILVLDDMDIVFENSKIAHEFSQQLRNWHNEARRGTRHSHLWQKLHTVILYSSDLYAQFDINNSPLVNVGSTLELPELNLEEIQQLAQQRGLTWNQEQVEKVMKLVGGHPHLLTLTLTCIQQRNLLLDDLNEQKLLETGFFNSYLKEQLMILESSPDLKEAFMTILQSSNSGNSENINLALLFKLQGLGLIKRSKEGGTFEIRCQLYQEYFKTYLLDQSVPVSNEPIS